MILNTQTATLIRLNASRLADSIKSKDDLTDLATANSFEQVFGAIESLLINTNMFFDDELLTDLDESSWQSFKALLLVYTLNGVNRRFGKSASKAFSESSMHERTGPQIL